MPNAPSVYTYFLNKLGHTPYDVAFMDLRLDSPCGKDCKQTIDACTESIAVCDRAARPALLEAANITCEVFLYGRRPASAGP
jgi:hypothetical protein